MELTFIELGNEYVAEFEVASDFNLHIERLSKKRGGIVVLQRTSGTNYAGITGWGYNMDKHPTIDVDFTGIVYPKQIKIICAVKPDVAIVTFAE